MCLGNLGERGGAGSVIFRAVQATVEADKRQRGGNPASLADMGYMDVFLALHQDCMQTKY